MGINSVCPHFPFSSRLLTAPFPHLDTPQPLMTPLCKVHASPCRVQGTHLRLTDPSAALSYVTLPFLTLWRRDTWFSNLRMFPFGLLYFLPPNLKWTLLCPFFPGSLTNSTGLLLWWLSLSFLQFSLLQNPVARLITALGCHCVLNWVLFS